MLRSRGEDERDLPRIPALGPVGRGRRPSMLHIYIYIYMYMICPRGEDERDRTTTRKSTTK